MTMDDCEAAGDAEMLVAVEVWARGRRFVAHAGLDYVRDWEGPWALHVNPLPPWGTILISPTGYDLDGVEVTPHAALVWALAVEAGLPPVDLGVCKRCRGRGTWSYWTVQKDDWPSWCSLWGPYFALSSNGPWPADTRLRVLQTPLDGPDPTPHSWRATITGPCPDCSAGVPGRACRAVERLLLEAGPVSLPYEDTTAPVSIEALLVLADRLQSPPPSDLVSCPRGQPRNQEHEMLGMAIAHLIADRREGTAGVVAYLRQRALAML